MPTITAFNNIRFVCSGSCDRCAGRGEPLCCKGCPHFSVVNGVNTCLIYATRSQVCESCKKLGKFTDVNGTHADCISWPQHPFMGAVRGGKCSYTFVLANAKDEATYLEMIRRWNGESI